MEETKKPSKKILVVEDNQDSRELVVKILKNAGYQIIEAVDGEEALEKVSIEEPHIILMDISLPKLDGYEVAKRLKDKEEFKHIPIVAFTAHAMKGDKEQCLKVGMDDYISKPIRADKLGKLLSKYVPATTKSEIPNQSTIEEIKIVNESDISINKALALERLNGNEKLYNKMCGIFEKSAPLGFANLLAGLEVR